MNPEDESRPGRATEATSNNTKFFTLSVPDLDAYARHVDGAFCVVVEMPGERYRRRTFLTAKAAERAARNAQRRGHNVRVYLAELKPLFWLGGGGL